MKFKLTDGAVQLCKNVASRGKTWGGGSVQLVEMTDVMMEKAWFAWQREAFRIPGCVDVDPRRVTQEP